MTLWRWLVRPLWHSRWSVKGNLTAYLMAGLWLACLSSALVSLPPPSLMVYVWGGGVLVALTIVVALTGPWVAVYPDWPGLLVSIVLCWPVFLLVTLGVLTDEDFDQRCRATHGCVYRLPHQQHCNVSAPDCPSPSVTLASMWRQHAAADGWRGRAGQTSTPVVTPGTARTSRCGCRKKGPVRLLRGRTP